MVEMREELSYDDLVSLTRVIHAIKPDTIGHVCVGVELPKLGDKNVVFHLVPIDKNSEGDSSILMVSADYLLEMFGND